MISQSKELDWRALLGFAETSDVSAVKQVIKRDGSLEKYNRWKIAGAIGNAVRETTGKEDKKLVEKLTEQAEKKLRDFMKGRHPNSAPAIEEIQDRWIGQDHRYFKVLGDDDAVYIIRQNTISQKWELTYFRQATADRHK